MKFTRYVKNWGDSTTQGSAGGIKDAQRWTSILMRRFLFPFANRGIGGETAVQILARMLQDETVNRADSIIWAGRNGVESLTTAEIMTTLRAMHTYHGASPRFLFLSVIPKTDGTEEPGSATRIKIDTLNAAILAEWPNNYLNVVTALASDATRNDGLHFNLAGHAIVAQLIGDKILELGWVEEVAA